MFDEQNSILIRKIALAEAERNAGDERTATVAEGVAGALRNWFKLKFADPAPCRRAVDKARLLTAPAAAHFLFRIENTEICVAFDAALVGAAVNAALGRPIGDATGAATAVDRSIAAILAGRIAGAALKGARGEEAEEIVLVQHVAESEDLKFDKASTAFEQFDWRKVQIGERYYDFSCAISAQPALASGAAKPGADPGWRAPLSAIARKTTVEFRAELGVINTDYGAALSLKPGDVMRLDLDENAIVRLCVIGGSTIGTGRLGAKNGVRAVRIVERH